MSYSPSNDIEKIAFKDASGFYTTKQRSQIMSKIRGKNTKPELILRKALWHLGYRYRLNVKKLPGTPDIVLKKYRIAIFIDGEFWHGKDWITQQARIKTNQSYWIPKIEKNMQRDRVANAKLESAGWTVLRYWSKEVEKDLELCLEEILMHLGYQKQTPSPQESFDLPERE